MLIKKQFRNIQGGYMFNKKQSSRLRLGVQSLLMVVMLVSFFGLTTARAQSISGVTRDTAKVSLTNTSSQSAVTTADLQIAVTQAIPAVHDTLIAVQFNNNYLQFAKNGKYLVSAKHGVGIITSNDTAYVSADQSTLYIPVLDTTTVNATATDTLTITGIQVVATKTSNVLSDGSVQDSFKYLLGNMTAFGVSSVNNNRLFRLYPAGIYQASVLYPAVADSTITAGNPFNAIVSFTDRFGNIPNDNKTAVTPTAIIPNSTNPGNGILTPGTLSKTVSAVAPGVDYYTWTGMTYSKAEDIQIKFTPSGGTSGTSVTLHFIPSITAAHISVSGGATTTTVDGSIKYTLYVTDANFNPVQNATVAATEQSPHGGTFSTINPTDANGNTSVTFYPSKFYTGADVIVFNTPATGTATASQTASITIGPGPVGGVIADYAGTASGDAVGTPDLANSELIAAGQSIYIRGFLRDTYGNPIDATDASKFTFTVNNKLSGHSTPGTSALTNDVTEDQYQNNNKTAIGAAVSFQVYNKVGKLDTLTVSYGNYSQAIVIGNRSNVPAKLKMLAMGGDSSIVASAYSNHSLVYTDTLWDQYGNLVVDPGTVTIAPKHSSYGVVFATQGLTAFVSASDTVVVDTLYPNANGAVTQVVSSGKKSGIDSLKTWAVSSSSSNGVRPIWVTPATFSKLAITPHVDASAIAGQTQTLTIEKQDQYGNHIDWGLSGGQLRGNLPNLTKSTQALLDADSALVKIDTLNNGNSHKDGSVNSALDPSFVGKAGVASIGGTLNYTFQYTAYASGADTQKVYASFNGAGNDTATIISMPTGVLAGFQINVAPVVGSDKLTGIPVGDSVKVTVTAVDSLGHRIYTYATNGQSLTVNHTAFGPVSTDDTTYYFSYQKGSKWIHVNGDNLQDTVFNQGQAVFYLFKFVVDSANTVTVSDSKFAATTTDNITYKPLDANLAYGHWSVTVPSTLAPTGPLTFTVTPRDKYYNVSYTPQNIIVNVASNQTSGFNVGSNPKVFNGPQTFTGSLTDAKGTLVIYVFDNNNANILGQSTPSQISATVNYAVSGKVTYGDGSMGVKNVVVTLNPGSMTDTTDATGAYMFSVPNGTYTLTATTSNKFLGADGTDALWASQNYNGTRTLSAIQKLAADVNANGAVNNTDGLLIVRRYVQLDSSFASGDWVFTNTNVTVNGSSVTSDLQGLVAGDVNESDSTQISTMKQPAASLALVNDGVISFNGKDGFDVPVRISGAANLAALSLRFTYPQDLATFEGASSKASVISNAADGRISIGWADFTGKNALKLADGDILVTLRFKPTADFKAGSKFEVQLDGNSNDLANEKGETLKNSKLNVSSVEVNVPKEYALRQNYPNPFNPATIIEYDLPVNGNVSLMVYNILGQKVATLVNQAQKAGAYKFDFDASRLASGTYIYRLSVQGDNGKSFTQVHKMLLLK